jgi:hypothetical protein
VRKSTWAAGLILATAAATAAEDPSTQPGLWDYTVKMEIPGMPVALPPQTFQQCVTQADVDSGKQYRSGSDQDCEVRNIKESADRITFDLACKDGTTGKSDFRYTASTLSGKTVMTREGQDVTLNMTAKRAGDCKK